MRLIPISNASTSRRGPITWLLALLLACVTLAQADELMLEVIPLQHRAAEELLPLLQPFVIQGGVIKAADNKFVVRTSPANLIELHKLITQLDQPLRRLLITVKQLSGDTARDSGASVQGRIGGQTEATVRVWETEKRDDADRLQQVQVLEGTQAFIDAGRQIPISDIFVEQSRSGMAAAQQTRYIGATTGFYARPRISGDLVSIDITPYQSTVQGTATPPAFNVQALHTTVTGKLGEWIELGASSTRVDEQGNEIVRSTSQRGEQDRRILLRVTEVP